MELSDGWGECLGRTVVPPTARAVVANVTATDTTAPSYLTAWPDQAPQPLASDLNWTAGQTVPNLMVVELGANGKLDSITPRARPGS